MTAEFETFEHAGLTVKLFYEEYDAEHANPRSADGNLGVMFCDYNRYTLGDADAPDPRDQKVTCRQCEGSGYQLDAEGQDMDCPKCAGEGEIEVSIVEYLKREHGARVILPLFVYEHGGVTMSCGGRIDNGEDDFDRSGRFRGGDTWDTSSVGVIFDTAETRGVLGDEITDENIVAILNDEVKFYAAYLEGMVFGYTIETADGDTVGGCGMFLEPDIHSDDAYIKTEAREEAESCAEAIVAEAAEAHRWACADVVTV